MPFDIGGYMSRVNITELPESYLKAKNEIYSMMAKPDKTIREHTDDVIRCANEIRELGYISEENYRLLHTACEYHDIGKANCEFQKRVNSDKKLRFNEEKEIPHNILSVLMIPEQRYLTNNKTEYAIIMYSILMHHNSKENLFEILEDLIYDHEDKFQKLIGKYLEETGKNIYEIDPTTEINKVVDNRRTVIIKGLLNKCDYAASGNYEVEIPNDFLLEKMRLLENKYKWNELQNFCSDNSEKNIIAVAQTGMGKTEAALLWLKNNKGFYILPVRTAINAMYDRIKSEIINDENIENRVALLHSNSLEKYISDEKLFQDPLEYNERGRNLSMPLTITTLDQIFDFVFKYSGYELKAATMSYSKVIIDEIQMYGPDLLAYLVYGLEMINKLEGKIAILTATLPPFITDILKKKIGFEYKEFNNDLLRHNVNTINNKINAADIIDLYRHNKKAGERNKILVICNTVKKSQEMYNELLDSLGDEENINLLHSKFIKKDREEKEGLIKECGQRYDIENIIWVSTSLVEASLDIDFDYLFTELQDLNSLFQRMGRCNRKGKKPVDKPNCYVYTEIDNNLLINGKKGFIDSTIYELSKLAINDTKIGLRGIITETQKLNLLNKYFTTSNIKNSDYYKFYNEKYNYIKALGINEMDKNKIIFRNIQNRDVIPNEIYDKYRDEIDKNIKIIKLEKDYKIRKIAQLNIKQLTVSIQEWEYKKYEKAVKNGKALKYKEVICLSEPIDVIECRYDDKLGYRDIDFENSDSETIIW